MFKNLFIALILLALSGVAAEAQTTPSRKKPVKRPVASKAKPQPVLPLARSIRTLSGLNVMLTKRGSGLRARAGQTVTVHYTGTLTNGVKFDSSRDRNEPISFPLGAGRVIKGWDEGIARLRVGDQAILVIPPALGYGERGAGGGLIPPDATLIFIVELVDIKDN